MTYRTALPTILCLLAVSTVSAGDWPTVGGGSARHGQSDETGPSEPTLLWEGSISAWFGGQIYIEGGRMATMRFQGIDVAPIVCYDLETGAELWSVDFPGPGSRSVPRGFRDGKVYATNFQETGSDTVYALDAATGDIVWIAEAFAERGIVWSFAFTEDGDLIVPGVTNDLYRVDHVTGAVDWTAPRTVPSTGAEGVCVVGNTVYGWEGAINTDKVITAWDTDTGAEKYSSPALPGDGDQEIPMMAGPDGTIYAQRDGGHLHALTDTGSGIVEKWNVPVNSTPVWGQSGVGLDGSVYVPDGEQLVALDPETGAELFRSEDLVTVSSLHPRVAVGADGLAYVGNGAFDDGAVFCLTPELEIVWTEPIPSIVYAGPALGQDGTLAVAGRNNVLKVYRSDPSAGPGASVTTTVALRPAFPNPLRSATTLAFRLDDERPVRLAVCDASGRMVRRLIGGALLPPGDHVRTWDGRDDAGRRAGAGVYFLTLDAGDVHETSKIDVLR